MKRTRLCAFLVLAISLALYGCTPDVPSSYTVTEGVAGNPGVLYGKIIDAQTRQGIPNATVYLKVNGDWWSTTTKGATTGGADNQAGDFTFWNLPVNSNMMMIVKGPEGSSYLSYRNNEVWISASTVSGPNGLCSRDYGKIELEQGVLATIYVVDATTGQNVTKSDGSALTVFKDWWGGLADETATRVPGSPDKYTIVVRQSGQTSIYVPAMDVNGDGKYDYQSASTTIQQSYNGSNYGPTSGQGNLTTTIALQPVFNDMSLTLVASNLRVAGQNSGGDPVRVISKNDPARMFFNMPVSVPVSTGDAGSLTMTYTDNFKLLASAAVTAEVAITAATSADGTLLTIAPATPLTEGQFYSVNGTVRSVPDLYNTTNDAITSIPTVTFYTTVTGSGTMGNNPVVTLDNFNYWTAGSIITSGETITPAPNWYVWAVFPEQVWGTMRVISRTSGPPASPTTTIINGVPFSVSYQDNRTPGFSPYYISTGSFAYWVKRHSTDPAAAFNNRGANREGPLYSMYIGYMSNDHSSIETNQFTLGIDVYDADGNLYQVEKAFNVE